MSGLVKVVQSGTVEPSGNRVHFRGMADTQKFRFLTDEEYFKLPAEQRMVYLRGASAELERRQVQLRELVKHMVKENEQK